MEELEADEYPVKDKCLGSVEGMAILAVTPGIMDIAEVYQERKLMPKNPAADSLHPALASSYRMDHLLSWNCRHLANATACGKAGSAPPASPHAGKGTSDTDSHSRWSMNWGQVSPPEEASACSLFRVHRIRDCTLLRLPR